MEKRTILQRFMEWTRLGRQRGCNQMETEEEERLERGEAMRIEKVRSMKQAKADGRQQSGQARQAQATALQPAPVDVAKLSIREETVLRIREGFKDLSGILGSMNANMEDQAKTSHKLDEKMQVLPSLLDETKKSTQQQGNLAETISKGIAESDLRQKEALKSIRALPVALAAIQENELASYKVLAQIREELQKRTAMEQDMSKSFKALDETMKQMQRAAQAQADQIAALEKTQKVMASDFTKSQKETVESFQISQDLALQSFGKAQNELMGSFSRAQEGLRRKMTVSLYILAAAFGIAAIAGTAFAINALSDLSDSHKAVARAAMSSQGGIKEEIVRLKEDNLRTVGKLNSLIKARQGELDLLMGASKQEMEKMGAEHAKIMEGKNREIKALREKVKALDAPDGKK